MYSFLDCGISENGIAKVQCEKCGNDYFVSFSCNHCLTPPVPFTFLDNRNPPSIGSRICP
ncbi:transposase zinc-binding domain-containing protein [Candidatus Desantisbacteria bacterium]|nr:transposase zinc-binding domain-containing protein [Candidatus Desantisbacteria bacterium]